MITKKKNWVEFVIKSSEDNEVRGSDEASLSLLEHLSKYYYKVERKEEEIKAEEENTNNQQLIIKIEERKKFENSNYVQKEIMKAFRELK